MNIKTFLVFTQVWLLSSAAYLHGQTELKTGDDLRVGCQISQIQQNPSDDWCLPLIQICLTEDRNCGDVLCIFFSRASCDKLTSVGKKGNIKKWSVVRSGFNLEAAEQNAHFCVCDRVWATIWSLKSVTHLFLSLRGVQFFWFRLRWTPITSHHRQKKKNVPVKELSTPVHPVCWLSSSVVLVESFSSFFGVSFGRFR